MPEEVELTETLSIDEFTLDDDTDNYEVWATLSGRRYRLHYSVEAVEDHEDTDPLWCNRRALSIIRSNPNEKHIRVRNPPPPR